jgi:hypothetical protein
LSDTIGYIGYDYLKNCSKNYETKFENCGNEELIDLMCDVIGIDKEVIIKNQNNSGGGQYLIKNTNYEVWEKIYKNSNELHLIMKDFYPSDKSK